MSYQYLELAGYEWDHLEQFARGLAEHIARELGVGDRFKVIFRNRRSSMRISDGNGGHRIVFGWRHLGTAAQYGFQEYKSLSYIVPRERPIGLEAVAWIVWHEMAHVVQRENGERWRHSVHNEFFVRRYAEIRLGFPYEAMLEHLMGRERAEYWCDRTRRARCRAERTRANSGEIRTVTT